MNTQATESIFSREIEGYQALKNKGEEMFLGQPIDRLIYLARLRADQISRLDQVTKALSSHQNLLALLQELEEVMNNLEQVKLGYPDNEAFRPRRGAIEVDIARAERLKADVQQQQQRRDEQAAFQKWQEFLKDVDAFYQSLQNKAAPQQGNSPLPPLGSAEFSAAIWASDNEIATSEACFVKAQAIVPRLTSSWNVLAQQVLQQMREAGEWAKQIQDWQRLGQFIHDFYRTMAQIPTESSLSQAAGYLRQAESIEPKPAAAQKIIEEMKRALSQAGQGYLKTQFQEAQTWLKQADRFLEEAHYREPSEPARFDPLAATVCLARAEAVINGITRRSNPAPEVEGLARQVQRNLERAGQALPQWLAEQRSSLLQSLQAEIKACWTSGSPLERADREELTRFLQTHEQGRHLVDQAVLYMAYVDTPEKWLARLVAIRQENLRWAAFYRQEVASCDVVANRALTYWAWRRIELIRHYDPDTKTAYATIADDWEKLESRFNGHIQEVENLLAGVNLGREDNLEKARQQFQQGQKLLKEQLEKPPTWLEKIDRAQKRMEMLTQQAEQGQRLVAEWKTWPKNLSWLIKDTTKFLNEADQDTWSRFKPKFEQAIDQLYYDHYSTAQRSYLIMCKDFAEKLKSSARERKL